MCVWSDTFVCYRRRITNKFVIPIRRGVTRLRVTYKMENFETPQPVQPTEPKTTNWPKIILAAVGAFVLLAGSAYAGYWYGSEDAKLKSQISKPQSKIQIPETPTSTPTSTPTMKDETADWKMFNYKEQLSFRYPRNWYIGKPTEIEEGNLVSFFLEGTDPDYSAPEYLGNEVLELMVYGDEGIFNNLRDYVIPKPTVTTIAGRPALRDEVNVDILIGSTDKKVLHLTVREGAKLYIDQILSTFRFLD